MQPHENKSFLSAMDNPQKHWSFYKSTLDRHAIVAETDRNGTIVNANDKFCELSGYSRDELLGANHRILNSGLHNRQFFAGLWRTIRGGKVWQGTIRNKSKLGRYYWVKTTIVPYRDALGKIDKYVSIRTDITEQVKAEEKLINLNHQLEEASSKLKFEREALNRKNIALHELLFAMEKEKLKVHGQIKKQLDEMIFPLLSQIKTHIAPHKLKYFEIFESTLRDIDVQTGQASLAVLGKLSSKEMQICEALKKGMASKEIADFYHISVRTTEKHCENIRRKLGLQGKQIKLANFLRNLRY